jgi:hypothetical protein
MMVATQASLMTVRGLAAPLDIPEGLPVTSGLAATRLIKTNPDAATKIRISDAYGKLPLSFEVNRGQTDSQVKYLARGPGYTLFLTATEAVLAFRAEGSGLRTDQSVLRTEQRAIRKDRTAAKMEERRADNVRRAVVRMKVVGANAQAKLEGLDELSGKSSYFLGNDPKKWRTNIPHFSKVRYRETYPGIDLVYYGNPRQLEYDFVISPGADPETITLAFEGVDRLEIDNAGNLILRVAGGHLIQRAPVINQDIHGARQTATGRYVIRDKNRVGFHVASYDAARPLVIDPVLVYSTFLGGSAGDVGKSIAMDGSGNAYVTGSTASVNFPVFPNPGAFQTALAGAGFSDAFVTKLNTTGTALVYSTYLGGGNADVGNGIAVDGAGNAYVTGSSASNDFPTTAGAFQTAIGNPGSTNTDAFVTKLNPAGGGGADLVYSTYLGGSNADIGNSIALDATPNVYVTGSTVSGTGDFPTTAGAFDTTFAGGGVPDAFVTKLNPAGGGGADLVYSTFLGGSASDVGNGIAVDAVPNVYVTGSTGSFDFPTSVGAVDTTLGGGAGITDAFVTKLNPAGGGGADLVYSTFLGGSASDDGNGIALDGVGNAYVTGSTASADFPTAGSPFQAALSIAPDAFVTKLNATGSVLVFSTYLGGRAADIGRGIAVDGSANAYVTGETASANFPTASFQAALGGGIDAFVTKITESSGPPVPPTPSGPSGCFIATAAYGSNLDPHVLVLREFRDMYLMTNSVGTELVRLYYSYSPPVAAIVAKHEVLRVATRAALTPVVYAVSYPLGGGLFFFAGLLALRCLLGKRYRHA